MTDCTFMGGIRLPAQSVGHRNTMVGSSHRLGSLGRIRVERDFYDPMAAGKRQKKSHVSLTALMGGPQQRMAMREAYCLAAIALHRAGKLHFTDASLQANMSQVRGDAVELARNLNPMGRDVVPISEDFRISPSPRGLRRWLKAREDLGLLGLVDNMSGRGNRSSQMSPEATGLMMDKVRGYLSKNKPTIKQIVEDVQLAFHDRNVDRAERGLGPLNIPSRETVRRAIRLLDPFAAECARNGEASARKKFRPVLGGLDIKRPLERVEVDDPALDGVAVQTWLTALRHTRAASPTVSRLDLVAVREAIKAISVRNAAAMAAAGLNLEDWTAERIEKAERSLLAGVEFFDRASLTRTNDQLGQTIPSVAGLTGAKAEKGRRERQGAGASQAKLTIEEE